MKIFLQPLANEDLDNIYNYYREEKKSLKAANDIINDILDELENLPYFLSIVSIHPIYEERGVNFLSVVVNKRRNYKIIFYIKNEIINVTTIWDCRRNPKALKELLERE